MDVMYTGLCDVMYTGLCDVMYTGHGCDVYWAMDVMYTGPWM